MSTTTTTPAKGLEGIVAATSAICYIDGDQGVLAYRGIDIHELASHSTFEETCYLLWNGRLPRRDELQQVSRQLAAERKLDPAIIGFMRQVPKKALPMEVLRTAVSALSFYDPDETNNDHDANVRKSLRLTSQIAMIVATYDRLRKGKEPVAPDASLSHAANFLWMLNGEKPSSTAEKALDIALILHADHELNASTFAARGIAGIAQKSRARRTCGGCRKTWDARPEKRSGSTCRAPSRITSSAKRNSTPTLIFTQPPPTPRWALTWICSLRFLPYPASA